LVAVPAPRQIPAVGWALLPFACAAACLFGPDRRRQAMLGDVGANALGALLGLTLAVLLPTRAQEIVAALVLAASLWADKHSLTEFIDRNPLLRWSDRLGLPKEDTSDTAER
jgi:drug/metabolite transporter (DMT)-like permease